MSDIDSTLFSSSEKLPKEFWASVGLPDLSTRNAGDFLSKHGWDGKAAAAVGLRLTPDNRSPEAARLILVGEWDKPIRIQANRVFQGADQEILMEIQLDDLSTFKCRENRMASNAQHVCAQQHGYYKVHQEEEGAVRGATGGGRYRGVQPANNMQHLQVLRKEIWKYWNLVPVR